MLVHKVDLNTGKAGVALVFKDTGGQKVARLKLPTKLLRQWPGMVHGQFRKAEWPAEVRPAWVENIRCVA